MIAGTVAVGFLHPGEWSACFGNSLLDLMFYDAATNQRITSHHYGILQKDSGSGQLVENRNYIAQRFLDDSEAEWLWMVDSDMGFAADTVDRLVEAADPTERPVVGGLCFAMKSAGTGDMYARRYRTTPTVYMMAETEEQVGFAPIFDYPPDQLFQCSATGAACLLVHRSALERVREASGDTWFDKIPCPKPKGGSPFSEDLSFCLRLAAIDIPLYVHTGVKTTHDKGGVFFDEDTYRIQQALIALR